jgi:hypothetical protein
MKRLVVFLLLDFYSITYAQNLVQNPSFETLTGCPIPNAYPYQSTIDQVANATHWNATLGSSDAYNSCSNLANCGVPEHALGYQHAFEGSSYCGIHGYGPSPPPFLAYTELVSNELYMPLQVGQLYHVSFYANSFNHGNQTVRLGATFTTESYNALTKPYTRTGFSHFRDTAYINDTLKWVLVQGTFVADSAYTHMIIGNFYPEEAPLYNGLGNDPYSYYYIDNVCVVEAGGDCDIASSIQSMQPTSSAFKLYPNPATDAFQLLGPASLQGGQLEIHDAQGRLVHRQNLEAATGPWQISTRHLPAGLYLLQCIDEQGIRFTEKLVIGRP